ncbi:MAG TPA: DEAD/DEAH box helicase, partial [Myxococcota bacterium]
ADARIALTGTPLENHTGELWALFHAVSPGLFGSWTEFRARFASPIEKDADVRRRRLLARAIAPFVLRRKKIDVAPELPPRTDVEERVTLDADERRAYQRIQQALLIDVLRPGAEDGDDRKLPANEKRVKILAAITKLRLVACHAQFASDIEREPAATPPGSKQRALVELLTSLRAAGHRALVFSQFVKHLEIARAAATTAGITSLQLDGSTPAKDREALVASFQAGDVDAFFLSLKAGGTGLNLVRASYVIHLDPWWNPAVEDQASDRAHRIGQTEPVTVVRLIADDTIEEEMLDLHNHKRALVDGVLAGTAVASTLSVDELVELIRHTRRSSNDDAQGPELADVENITNRRP